MPTYEYRCPEGHESEDFVLKISAAKSEIPCPVCGAMAARRVSAGAGLVFKGSGFYITDYGKDGKKDQKPAAASSGDSSSVPTAASVPATSSATTSGAAASSGAAAASTAPAAATKSESTKSDSAKSSASKKSGPSSGSGTSGAQ